MKGISAIQPSLSRQSWIQDIFSDSRASKALQDKPSLRQIRRRTEDQARDEDQRWSVDCVDVDWFSELSKTFIQTVQNDDINYRKQLSAALKEDHYVPSSGPQSDLIDLHSRFTLENRVKYEVLVVSVHLELELAHPRLGDPLIDKHGFRGSGVRISSWT